MSDDDASLVRKVYFFRIEHFQELMPSLLGALQRIENLPFNDTGRYLLETPSQSRLCVWPDTLEFPVKLRFGRIRRDLLPDVENAGQLDDLPLQEDAGLIDLGHLMIFEDGHVAGEWNPDGPKIARLTAYLLEKGGMTPPPKFRNLFERDIVDVVSRLGSVRILDIDIPHDSIELAREADQGLGEALEATSKLGASKKIGLTLTATQGSATLRDLAVSIAQLIKSRPRERERFLNVKATGRDQVLNLNRVVDVLEDKLVSSEYFPRRTSRSRSLDSGQAYALIEGAYIRRKETLPFAATAIDF